MARLHPSVGIDLGTTNSAVAYVDATGRPETIRSAEGGLTTPSAVFFDRSRPIVGVEALEAGMEEPGRLARFAKRDVGERAYRKTICGESFPPEVLQGLVLGKLKEDAELALGQIEQAVVTVPAFFNEPCRKATQDAGRLAGLEVLDIINEPTAAAICFGVQQGFLSTDGVSEKKERVLVYDLGGGTFDVTVMEIEGREYQTIATNGDVYLGGMDWDRRIVDHLAESWVEQHDCDPREDPHAELALLRKANQAKHSLSLRDSVVISVAHDGQRLRGELDQATFRRLTEDLLERTLMTVALVLDEAAMNWSDLSRLILVGGATRMPMIRDELSRLSGLQLDRSLSPDEAVAHGAAIYAGIRLGQNCDSFSGVSVTNVNSHDLGVLAKDPKTGEPRRQVMIKRNTQLPASKRVRFRTHEQGQRNVKVEVVEGGDDKGNNATPIGKCLVDQLPTETPKGTFVDVRFDYAGDGRLTVGATLPELERAVKLTLRRASGMTEDVLQTWRRRIEAGLSPVAAESPAKDESAKATPLDIQTAVSATRSPADDPVPLPPVAAKRDVSDIDIDIEDENGASRATPTVDPQSLDAFLRHQGLTNSKTPIDSSAVEIQPSVEVPSTKGTKKLRRRSPQTPGKRTSQTATSETSTSETAPVANTPVKKLLRKETPPKTDDARGDWRNRGRKISPGDKEQD